MTRTRLQRRRKRVRMKQTQRVRSFKKTMLKPRIRKVDVEEIEKSFLTK